MEYRVYWLLKSSCFELSGEEKYGFFSSLKIDGKMIFTDHWKFLVFNFSEMGNTIFSWATKLMERWYLLGLFELFVIFQGVENMFFCAVIVPASQVEMLWSNCSERSISTAHIPCPIVTIVKWCDKASFWINT